MNYDVIILLSPLKELALLFLNTNALEIIKYGDMENIKKENGQTN